MTKQFKSLKDALKATAQVASLRLVLEQDEYDANFDRLRKAAQFPMLKELILSAEGCEIPETISNLKSLEWLRIELLDCGDDPLPESIGLLVGLRTLEIERNEIKKLPSAIGKLIHLRALSLSQSSIRELPSSIGACKEMEVLDCAECHELEVVPPEIGMLKRLMSLRIGGCFSRIPVELSYLINLEELELCGRFTVLPPELASLPNLKRVYIRGRFSQIELSSNESNSSLGLEIFQSAIDSFNSESQASSGNHDTAVSLSIPRESSHRMELPLRGVRMYPSFMQAALPGEEVLTRPSSARHESVVRAVDEGEPVIFVSEYADNQILLGHLGIGTLIESARNDCGLYSLKCGERVRLTAVCLRDNYLFADIDICEDTVGTKDEFDFLTIRTAARTKFETHLKAMRTPKGLVTKELVAFEEGLVRADGNRTLSFFIASKVSVDYETRQQLLSTMNEAERLKILGLL